MPALLDELNRFLDDDKLRLLSRHLKTDLGTTRRGVRAALPVLIIALQRDGAASPGRLHETLVQHHDGSLLENLNEVLERSTHEGSTLADASSGVLGGVSIDRESVDGNAMASRLFGERRTAVELGLSKASGMQVSDLARLVATLAPIVMSALGRLLQRDGMQQDDVVDLLEMEVAALSQAIPGDRANGIENLFEAEEGQVVDEIERLGSDVLRSGVLEGVLAYPNA